jgi:hypothetical protein
LKRFNSIHFEALKHWANATIRKLLAKYAELHQHMINQTMIEGKSWRRKRRRQEEDREICCENSLDCEICCENTTTSVSCIRLERCADFE